MAQSFYVSPEQLMQDKAEFAKKGIGRGRATVVMRASEGVLFVAHNPGASLHKISEIYDRVGFAGAGRYSEFESMRKAGVRHADVTGYTYSREDVNARSLANGYSQMLGEVFAHEVKPMEVELAVAQAGDSPDADEIYRISFDGNISSEGAYAVVGGDTEKVLSYLEAHFSEVGDLAASLKLCRDALQEASDDPLTAADFEVGFIERGTTGRAFQRLSTDRVETLLSG
ncbi:MAG: proteasome subunit alpha [Leptospirillia bacterium]